MRLERSAWLWGFFCLLAFHTGVAAFGQQGLPQPEPSGALSPGKIAGGFAEDLPAGVPEAAPVDDELAGLRPSCTKSYLSDGCGNWSGFTPKKYCSPIYFGAEYLLLRAHFSQAIAFAQVTDSIQNGIPNEQSNAREINFRYNSAFRTYLGYHLSPDSDLQVTYFHLNTSVAVNGTPALSNQFYIDAFADRAAFGQTMATKSSIQLNIFDIDYVRPYVVKQGKVGFRVATGLRFADIRQHYDSTTYTAAGLLQGQGVFNTRFFGVGPHFSVLAQARRRANSPFSLMARAATSLLVGGYSVSSGAVFPGVAGGGQAASRTLTVPVIEAELGGAWQPTETLMFTAGWLFQAYYDLGVSGGTDGGKFIEADTSNIMAFDGLFVRGFWRY